MELVWAPPEFGARNSAATKEDATTLNENTAGSLSEFTCRQGASGLVEKISDMPIARIYQRSQFLTNRMLVA
jgi:hypothetical protein